MDKICLQHAQKHHLMSSLFLMVENWTRPRCISNLPFYCFRWKTTFGRSPQSVCTSLTTRSPQYSFVDTDLVEWRREVHSVNPFDNIHWGLFIHPGCYEIGSEHGGRLLRTQHCRSSLNKFNTQYGHAKFIQAYLYLKNVFLIISLITPVLAPMISKS